jgi:hypothetical protein
MNTRAQGCSSVRRWLEWKGVTMTDKGWEARRQWSNIAPKPMPRPAPVRAADLTSCSHCPTCEGSAAVSFPRCRLRPSPRSSSLRAQAQTHHGAIAADRNHCRTELL